jgi:hypothetical protein
MDLAKFVSMLQNEALYFSVLAKLGDDLEAAPPKLPSSAGPLEQQRAFHFWSLNRCITFASCWHLAPDESAAMWAVYAGRNQGIAIQSTINSISRAFPAATEEDTKKILKIGLVRYIDPDAEEKLPFLVNSYQLALTKRYWYSYENELRIMCSPIDNWVEPLSVQHAGGFKRVGLWVHCNLKQAIERVIIAPNAPAYFESAVREVFKRFGFDPALVKASRLNERPMAPDADAVRLALNSLADVAEDINRQALDSAQAGNQC